MTQKQDLLIKLVIMLLTMFAIIMFLVSYAGAGHLYIADSATVAAGDESIAYEQIPVTYETTMPEDILDQVRLAVFIA